MAATEDRKPNAVLRRLRVEVRHQTREEFAASMAEAARELGLNCACNWRYVAHLEDGTIRMPGPAYRRILERTTGQNFSSLGWNLDDESGGSARVPGLTVEVTSPLRVNRPWGQDGDDRVLRREFVQASMATMGLATAADPAPSSAIGHRIGLSTVRQLSARTARLRRLDNFLGGGETYDLYKAELDLTRVIIRTTGYDEATGRALVALVAEQAQQAGWAAFDAGRHDEAAKLYETSLTAAREAGDRSLAANALAYSAYQRVSDDRSGVELAAAACETAGRQAPRSVQALLLERLAWACAANGRTAEAERSLAMAEAALDRADDQPQPDWSAWVDRDEIRIMTGRCWAELRRPLRAVPVLEDVLRRFDDSHARDKALYLTWLADAYAGAGEVEQAAVTIAHSLDLSTGVGSVRPRRRAVTVLEKLAPHRTLPPVAAVFERLSARS
ncbi:XRE family transcriptional regulator [Embleya sp. MST-111070]|uniref:XRE family transcriptional regulator n=1 Tax=Embleya sp. MST-111070 TaxID=3398231 RepID=UPI003F738CFA